MEIAIWIIAICEALCFCLSLYNTVHHEKETKMLGSMEAKYSEFVESQKDRGVQYHCNCTNCGKEWWMHDAFPAECPYCHAKVGRVSEL